MTKKVLLTGIAGFIGSHMLDHLLVNTNWHIIGVASFMHKGKPERVFDSVHYRKHRDRVEIMTHDLTTPFNERELWRLHDVDYIINVASESHVDRSLLEPRKFILNNVQLMLTMLEAARVIKPQKFIQVSTDEVYGPAEDGYAHKEGEPHRPSNPYSASKAAQEDICYAYWRSFGVPIIQTNTMNNIGERQDAEKFVPMVIRKVLAGEQVVIHGSHGNIGSRYYLHARNHADAILHLLRMVTPVPYGSGEMARFNVVGEKEIDNLAMAELVASFVGKELDYRLEDFHKTRPGHDRRYALDGAKIQETGWQQPFSLEESLKKTVEWELERLC